jgi:hypothetical protein
MRATPNQWAADGQLDLAKEAVDSNVDLRDSQSSRLWLKGKDPLFSLHDRAISK